jgi:hypothetical protein
MSGCGADILAKEIETEILADLDFDLPVIDLSGPDYQLPVPGTLDDAITRLTNADLTEMVVDGSGTFDVIMKALRAHLQREFESNRINGEQYAKVFIELTQGAMSQAVQFLLARDTSYWQSVIAQQQALIAQTQAITARVELETAKMKMAAVKGEALANRATYALTTMKLSTESIQYCIGKYNFDNILPAQLELLEEQKEAQRAQTMNTRSDGVTTVVGLIGKQKDLYTQQITSYQRDSEVKAAKMFVDAWITMKTIDEGLLPPDGFENTSLDEVLLALKVNNGLD